MAAATAAAPIAAAHAGRQPRVAQVHNPRGGQQRCRQAPPADADTAKEGGAALQAAPLAGDALDGYERAGGFVEYQSGRVSRAGGGLAGQLAVLGKDPTCEPIDRVAGGKLGNVGGRARQVAHPVVRVAVAVPLSFKCAIRSRCQLGKTKVSEVTIFSTKVLNLCKNTMYTFVSIGIAHRN